MQIFGVWRVWYVPQPLHCIQLADLPFISTVHAYIYHDSAEGEGGQDVDEVGDECGGDIALWYDWGR